MEAAVAVLAVGGRCPSSLRSPVRVIGITEPSLGVDVARVLVWTVGGCYSRPPTMSAAVQMETRKPRITSAGCQ